MNVYVRALGSALTHAGIPCDVFTRAEHPAQAPVVTLEPGFRVFHVDAGPKVRVPKEDLPGLLDDLVAGFRHALVSSGGDHLALHGNYWLSGAVAHQLKHELSMPMASTFHTLDRVKAANGAGEPEPARSALEEAVARCSDLLFASTTAEATQLIDLYGADPDRIEVVPPGVDHALFASGDRAAARRGLGFPAGRPVLLFVGRIQRLKGLDLAIETLAELRDPHALLVAIGGPSGPGGHEELSRVRDLASDLGVAGQIRWVPPRRHADLVQYYRAADVCVVPSRSESFGLVALEAAASGTPVVAASVGGLRSLIDDGSTGFLVDGREPRAYASAVATILGDGELAGWMGANAASASLRYSWTMTAARMRRLYGDLTARAPVQCS